MARHLTGLQAFTVDVRGGYDVLQTTGQKIEFGESRVVTMARPSRLRVEEVASDGKRDLALFDGKTVTVMNADANVYAQAPQPQSIDDALVYFVRDLRMRMPLALLTTTRLPAELSQRVKLIDFVESSDIDGVPVHHLIGTVVGGAAVVASDDDDEETTTTSGGALPCTPSVQQIEGVTYYLCGSQYYVEVYGGSGPMFMPVAAPTG